LGGGFCGLEYEGDYEADNPIAGKNSSPDLEEEQDARSPFYFKPWLTRTDVPEAITVPSFFSMRAFALISFLFVSTISPKTGKGP
jgi:hypothetical protein